MEANLLQAPFYVAVLGKDEKTHRSVILFNAQGDMFVAARRMDRRELEVGEELRFYIDPHGNPISWSFQGFDGGKHIGHARESKLKPLWEQLASRLGVPA